MKFITLLSLFTLMLSASQVTMLFDACADNHEAACYEIGMLYEEGIGLEQNLSKAEKFYKKACHLQSDEACQALDHIQK